jgi:predicted amidophosphoribosyltransferase
VHTTGATLRASARTLREGGARRVTVLTALRTLR